MKSTGKFIWRLTKNMVGSVLCVAILGFSGYYVSLGLNWLTGVIMKFLTTSAEYLMSNWVAVIVVVIALTLGGMAFESIVNYFKNRKSDK